MSRVSTIRSLHVVLTAGCNLSCSYCFQNKKKRSSRMDWETLRTSVDLLLASDRDEVKLCFYGGEPLLEFDLVRRAVDYTEAVKPAGKKPIYYILTNGTLLREEQAAFLARHRFQTHLSFDGVPQVQAERGKNTFRVLDALLDRLRTSHPRYFREDLYVVMTLLPATVRYLAESFAYFVGKGLKRICLSTQVTDSSHWRPEQIEEFDRQFARVYGLTLERYRETGEVLLDNFRKRDDDHRPPTKISMCGVGEGETLAVDYQGEVHGCVSFIDSYQSYGSDFLKRRLDAMRIGDLRADDFAARLATYPQAAEAAKIFDDKQDKYSSYRECRECRYLPTCSVCPVSIGNIPGNDDPHRVPDFLCAYNLTLNKYRERFPRQDNPIDILTGNAHIPRQMLELRSFVEATQPDLKARHTTSNR